MIYLMRHGLDDESCIGGWSNVHLVSEGIEGIIKSRDYIEDNLKVDKIITSDITRAVETTNIVNERMKLEVIKSSLLRELNKGLLNGMPLDKANLMYPEYVNVKDINTVYPNGESMVMFYERIKNNLDKILSMDNVLLITHRGVINMIYYLYNDKYVDMNKKKFNVTHASIHEVNKDKRLIRKLY